MSRRGLVRPLVPRSSAIFLAFLLALAWSAQQAHAAVLHCGDTVTRSVSLSSDVVCSGPHGVDGLTVGADGIAIKLAGHSVVFDGPSEPTGPADTGIAFAGHHAVTVSGGVVRGFSEGLRVDGDDNTVSQVRSVGNLADGVVILGNRNRLLQSQQIGNGGAGTLVTGRFDDLGRLTGFNNRIDGDTATGNLTGIEILTPAHPMRGNSIDRSQVSGNQRAGVHLFGQNAAAVTRSALRSNGGFGLLVDQNFNDSLVNNGLTIRDNRVSGNPIGLFLLSVNSSLVEANIATGNDIGFYAERGSQLTFARNRAQLNRDVGFRLLDTGRAILRDNIAGSVQATSGGTDGNGAGILMTGSIFNTTLSGNSANSNKTGDGIRVQGIQSNTLSSNTASRNAGDGIAFLGGGTLTANRAAYNQRYGIEAGGGTTDGGGNKAFGNAFGQCVGVVCS